MDFVACRNALGSGFGKSPDHRRDELMTVADSVPQDQPHLRTILADAIYYWELRRIPYNLVLTAVIIAWIILSWPHFRPALTWPNLLTLAVLAMLANLCYCAAYIADVSLQFSSFQNLWRRRRWILWLVGTLFAILLTNYWVADEVYSYVSYAH